MTSYLIVMINLYKADYASDSLQPSFMNCVLRVFVIYVSIIHIRATW